jgi:serine/threonine-protein kinase
MEELALVNPQGYEDVCYEIGEAYLFYYNIGVEKDKYSTAATWFQYAGSRYPVAQMYCDISECLNNITKFSKAEQFAKLNEAYVELWDQINTLDKKVREYDDDLKIRVWNEIVDMIRNNAGQFCEVAQKQEITDMLDNIRTGCEGITNNFLQSKIEALKSNIETTANKIASVRTGQAG